MNYVPKNNHDSLWEHQKHFTGYSWYLPETENKNKLFVSIVFCTDQ